MTTSGGDLTDSDVQDVRHYRGTAPSRMLVWWQDVLAPGATGLTSAEAGARSHRDGPNQLPAPKRPSAVRRFARPARALLRGDAVGRRRLAFVAGLPAARHRHLRASSSSTPCSRSSRRAGPTTPPSGSGPAAPAGHRPPRRPAAVQVDAADVVVGDVLVLEAGDRVPADATVVDADGLLVDTSLLTGESEPAPSRRRRAVRRHVRRRGRGRGRRDGAPGERPAWPTSPG